MKPLLEVVGDVQIAQENIRAGSETTGSSLHDGLIALYGVRLIAQPHIIANYERVAGELQDKQDQPVLLVHSRTKLEGCTGFGGRGQRVTETDLILGVLTGTDLLFDYAEQTCALPTAEYARKHVNFGNGGEPEMSEGNLPISQPITFLSNSFDLGTDLDRKLPALNGDLGNFSLELQAADALTALVGRAAIDAWITSRERTIDITLHSIQSACRALSIEPFGPAF